mmetsp:Transcript_11359/g.22299  ORF Transcript_11359/g.22299 Transcript_11359/m.22299 type:complete len:188 (-) Transcript_11359:29-592(-)|eukprot:CAMPEP_0204896292 /NCGR_PEP_ID=MMETSP1397-20131031/82_1 /ASSEMBLY_ACC=CAM_ASM_000891 /TAXON_ID=49980 /ORGANISM="Climacostomum Climacostomum virens, Strain Stock W-24" /LENGTH=187 /DNA_ID=CAMNT_0052063883 /DNA_START=324 /DNA_END=887 /DNA_ORIENTATION=+
MSESSVPPFKPPAVKVHCVYTKPRVFKKRHNQKPVVFDSDLSIQALNSEREIKPLLKPTFVPSETPTHMTPAKPNIAQSPQPFHTPKPKTLKKFNLEPDFPAIMTVTTRASTLLNKPKQPGKLKRNLSNKVVQVSPLSNLLLKIQESSSYNSLSPWSGMNSRELTSSRSYYNTLHKNVKVTTVKFPH